MQSAYADGRGNGADFGHNDDKDPWKRVELLKRSPLTIDRILADGAYCTKTLFKTAYEKGIERYDSAVHKNERGDRLRYKIKNCICYNKPQTAFCPSKILEL